MTARRVLYWTLWPLEQLLLGLARFGRLLRALIIASNPVLLAIWILRRDKRRQEEDK